MQRGASNVKCRHFFECALALSVLAMFESPARAEIILSSYPVRTEGSSFAFSSTSWEAIGFRTGSGYSYDLRSITMRLSSLSGGLVEVGVYSSGVRQFECGWSQWGGSTYCSYRAPESLIGQLHPQSISTKDDYKFLANGLTRLLPDTLYWIVFKGVGSGDFKYYEHAYADVPYTGDPGWGFSPWQGLYRSEVGATPYDFEKSPGYGSYSNGTFIPGVIGYDWSPHSGLNAIEIIGAASTVPEPSTFALLFIATLGCLLADRARRTDSSERCGQPVQMP